MNISNLINVIMKYFLYLPGKIPVVVPVCAALQHLNSQNKKEIQSVELRAQVHLSLLQGLVGTILGICYLRSSSTLQNSGIPYVI